MSRLKRKVKVARTDFVSFTNLVHTVTKRRQVVESANRKKRAYRDEGFHLSSKISLPEGDERYCAREQRILRAFSAELEPWMPNDSLRITFLLGHEIHRMIQSIVRDMGVFSEREQGFYGRWTCRMCKKVWIDYAPLKCRFCNGKLRDLKYLEYRFNNKTWELQTTTDGLLWTRQNNEWYEDVVEIKSIKSTANFYGDVGWNELMEPLPQARIQAQSYANLRRLEHEAGMVTAKGKPKKLPNGIKAWPSLREVMWVYVNKNTGEIKEYHERVKKRSWLLVAGRITEVRESEKRGTYPPQIPKCVEAGLSKSKKWCNVAEICFKNRKVLRKTEEE